MEFFFDGVFSDPIFYLGALLAGTAAFGFVVLLSGFFPGIVPALKESGNIEHLKHQRTRAVWGLYLMIAAFIIWQLVRWLLSAFT